MAARLCRGFCPSFMRHMVVFSQHGQRGVKFAGRIRVKPPVNLSISRHMSVFSKTSWTCHPNPATSILNVCLRQLYSPLRSRIDHDAAVGLISTIKTSKQTLTPIRKLPGVNSSRNINTCSKLGKRKTCKAVAKRFLRTGKGKLKRWRAGKSHNMMSKGKKRSRQLRKPTYASKQQLKLLNKMLNGW